MSEHHTMRQTLALIDPPSGTVLSLANCKKALGITGTDQDLMLTAAINAAVSELDAGDGGWLGRALAPQTWELRLWGFQAHKNMWERYCNGAIVLPYPPLIDVVSVKYDDQGGTEQTLLEGTDFQIFGDGSLGKQAIAPLYLHYWPFARVAAESVRIRFECGYEDGFPPKLTSAIALMVRQLISASSRDPQLFEDRVEGLGSKRYQNNPQVSQIIQQSADRLLSTLRVY